jgi:hypothetical protein
MLTLVDFVVFFFSLVLLYAGFQKSLFIVLTLC